MEGYVMVTLKIRVPVSDINSEDLGNDAVEGLQSILEESIPECSVDSLFDVVDIVVVEEEE